MYIIPHWKYKKSVTFDLIEEGTKIYLLSSLRKKMTRTWRIYTCDSSQLQPIIMLITHTALIIIWTVHHLLTSVWYYEIKLVCLNIKWICLHPSQPIFGSDPWSEPNRSAFPSLPDWVRQNCWTLLS